jgi:hypothetical protein
MFYSSLRANFTAENKYELTLTIKMCNKEAAEITARLPPESGRRLLVNSK